jgi:SAM-dependent MidA family methyltransferase
MNITPLEAYVSKLIRSGGSITFAQFMDYALYHPEHGFYRSGREVFGREGDFFTAEQLQPVFGELLRTFVGDLARSSGIPSFQVVELGSGRADLADSLKKWNYQAVDFVPGFSEDPELPATISGLVLANEFFDALPVRLLRRNAESWSELVVSLDDHGQFCFVPAVAQAELLEYAREYGDEIPIGGLLEMNEGISPWCRRIGDSLSSGFLLVIDYGYEPRELRRFPSGSLLSYDHHQVGTSVLNRPGEQDITAHVNFAHLVIAARSEGLEFLGKQTLAAWALSVWPEKMFARLFKTRPTWLPKWKQLVLGMGESFHVLLFRKGSWPSIEA